jgi:hypothetical protein
VKEEINSTECGSIIKLYDLYYLINAIGGVCAIKRERKRPTVISKKLRT